MFQRILENAGSQKREIKEEFWRVSDKLQSIRSLLRSSSCISLEQLFSAEHSRDELIVTFLAILELMKGEELFVGRDTATDRVMIFARDEE